MNVVIFSGTTEGRALSCHVPSLLAEPDRLRELGDKAWEYGIRDAADTMARRVLELA